MVLDHLTEEKPAAVVELFDICVICMPLDHSTIRIVNVETCDRRHTCGL